MKLKKRKGGAAGFIIFLFIATVLASGTITFYTIFMKPEAKSTVPKFTGLSNAEAVSQAESLGLVVQVESVASTLPEGIVLAQSPQPETKLRKGLVVVLQVSRGGELHAIPDVKGKTLTQAQSEIKSGGFSLGDVVKINEPNVKAGTVIAQSPSAPANIAAGGKIHLLVQDGGTAIGDNITVPDVNRMTEAEAKNLLETSGIKVQGINRVYSPLLPEGLAIETTPSAGSTLKAGQGVMLKLATQKRPAGFMDANSNSNSNVRRVTNQPSNTNTNTQTPSTPKTQTANNNTNKNVTVSVRGEEDVFIGDDYSELTPATNTAQKNSNASTSTPKTTQTASQTPTTNSSASSSGGSKTAKIRYVVPPIARPMDLRIEITDPSGKREIMNKQVRSGESINTTAKYSQECMISIYLGGESVWQERQR